MPRAADSAPDPVEVAESLRVVLAAVDAGDVAADDAQRAYIAGAADALESLARPFGDEHPDLDLR